MRLNKYLSDAGVCSRREADRLTEAGEITVNGKRAETGMQVESGDVVAVKGKTVVPEEKKVYLAFNKPRGIVCTAEKREKNTEDERGAAGLRSCHASGRQPGCAASDDFVTLRAVKFKTSGRPACERLSDERNACAGLPGRG